MSEKEDIRIIKERILELESFKSDIEIKERIEEGVKRGIQIRCAAAWASILAFVSVASGLFTLYSDILKEAAKAALRVIVGKVWP